MYATTRSTDPTAEKVAYHPVVVIDNDTKLVNYNQTFEDEDDAVREAQKVVAEVEEYVRAQGYVGL